MDHNIFRIPLLSFFFRTSYAIPIAGAREDPVILDRAFDAIAQALEQGNLVGIFPEGRLTSDGEIAQFRGGVKRIVERTPVPVVPMALSGLWHSLFARHAGKLKRAPSRLFPRVRLIVGPPVQAARVEPQALRETVAAMRGDWQ
jgi:1-acyl-sn-glycerol-3-phosphate acyltransferase